MATIKLLSWNIEHLGPKKLYMYADGQTRKHPNWDALAKTIVDTAYLTGANVLSFLEVASACAETIVKGMKQLLNKRYNTTSGNHWESILLQSNKTDTYALLYRPGQGFTVRLDSFKQFVAGCNNFSVNEIRPGEPGRLAFHSRMTKQGGRNPAYCLFETTDRGSGKELLFTVFAYHAMFNSCQQFNTIGISNIPLHRATKLVNFDGSQHNVAKTIISGDFNCNYLSYPNAYSGAKNLGAEAVSSSSGNSAKSTLVNNSWNFATTLEARANAYDNIFASGTMQGKKGVVDMLGLFMSGKALSGCAQSFSTAHIKNGNMIAQNPPQAVEDAWHIYIVGVSNHLPVFAEITV